MFGLERAGRDRGRDGVRGVVEAVDVVERDGQGEDRDQGGTGELSDKPTSSRDSSGFAVLAAASERLSGRDGAAPTSSQEGISPLIADE